MNNNDNFNKNDYETPDWVANAMASMILYSDDRILEPCAGTGQILKEITKIIPDFVELDFCEINEDRASEAYSRLNGRANLFNHDFLGVAPKDFIRKYKLIITNPPFDYALEFIEHSLKLLDDQPDCRLIYLLPIDTFSSKGRASYFQSLDAHISNITIIPGRIDYLKNGVPVSKTQKVVGGVLQYGKNGKPIMCGGRQVSDAIFTIKKGKGNTINFLEA